MMMRMSKGRRRTPTFMLALGLVLALILAACAGDEEAPVDEPAATPDEEPAEGPEEDPAEEPDPDDDAEEEAAASISPDDLEPLSARFTWFPAFHSMVIFVADDAGFWDDLNLDVEMIRAESGSAQYAMLNAGQADWANAGLDTVAQGQAEGREFYHVFPAVNKMSMNLVVHNDVLGEYGITEDSSLQDRFDAFSQMTVGYTAPNAPTDIYARYMMRRGGIDPETEGNLISVGSPPNLIAALRTGQIDAFMLTPPSPNLPEIEGFGTIMIKSSAGEVEELSDFPYTGFSAMRGWVEDPENHEKTVRFVAGLIMASELIANEPEQALEHLAVYFEDMDEETLRAGFEDIRPSVPDDPLLTEESVQRMMEILYEENIFDFEGVPDASEGVLWTNEFVEEAMELLEGLGWR